MVKSKFVAIAASAALVAMLGLTACGGQAASSAASAASSSAAAEASSAAAEASSAAAEASSEAAEAASEAAEAASSEAAEASSEAAGSEEAVDDEKAISWDGFLSDGSTVSLINSEDGTQAAISITKEGAKEPKVWMGAISVNGDKSTITDDETGETITFALTAISEDGVMSINVDGYGEGVLAKMTAADYKRAAELEEFAESFNQPVDWEGVLENGSSISYLASEDGSEAAVSITPAGAKDAKIWLGAVTTDDSGKTTITDEKTGETITYTLSEPTKDGTMDINVEGHGKGTLVQMTVGDYKVISELEKAVKEAQGAASKSIK